MTVIGIVFLLVFALILTAAWISLMKPVMQESRLVEPVTQEPVTQKPIMQEPIMQESKLVFAVGGCEKEKQVAKSFEEAAGARGFSPVKNIVVKVVGDAIFFSHDLSYACCAKIDLEHSMINNTINVTEVNNGRVCKCMCNYAVDASIGPLAKGAYTLRVYGVKYLERQYEPKLLFEREVEVE